MSSKPQRTAVIGLGDTGLATLRHLAAAGDELLALDTRAVPPHLADARAVAPDATFLLGELDPQLLSGMDRVVVSPGVSLATPAIVAAGEAGVEIVGDIELFARQADAPVVAVTGSNGKSTVTAMLAAMFAGAGRDAAVGGNYGTPALELLERDSRPDVYLLELSSFQLESTRSLKPRVAAILNISADHLDRYADLDAYAAAKARIATGARSLVINGDDPRTVAIARGFGEVVSFTGKVPGPEEWGLVRDEAGRVWLQRGARAVMAADELPLVGRHNQLNALAALAMGAIVGLPEAAMVAALTGFTGLRHRCELVARRNGIDWVNDSKGTNVGATLAAVAGIEGAVVLIVGGEGKEQDFGPLRDLAPSGALRAVVTIGRDGPAIAAPMKAHVPVVEAGEMSAAVSAAREYARPGDTVLLSPACASFDQFGNYQERGECFRTVVEEMPT